VVASWILSSISIWTMPSVLAGLAGEVSAQSDHRTGIITITVHDLNPEMAARSPMPW